MNTSLRLILSLNLMLLAIGCEKRNRQQDDSSRLSLNSTDVEAAANRRNDLIDRAGNLQRTGKHDEAIAVLRTVLVNNAIDYEAIFMLANAVAAQGKVDEAIDILADIPPDHPDAGVPSLGASADWCIERKRYDEAEQHYRKLLQVNPTVNAARRKLAFLFNCQGRRHEAVELIRELCLAGDVTQDELHSLIVEADAMYDAPESSTTSDERLYLPIGASGQARYLFTQRKYEETVQAIEPLVLSKQATAGVIALFGFAIVEAQDDVRFQRWLDSQVTEQVKVFPEYWAAIGTHFLAESKFDLAIGALAEAIRLDPTDLRSTRRMLQAFRSLNDDVMIARWMDRYAALTDTLNSSLEVSQNKPPSKSSILELVSNLQGLERRLESILWQSIALIHHGGNSSEMSELNRQMNHAIRQRRAFAGDSDVLCGLETKRFPAVQLQMASPILNPRSTLQGTISADVARFSNISAKVGLDHRYKVATSYQEQAFAIYQQYGGGVAVIDYDLDGQVDLFFAQGAAEPPDFIATESNQLYRTLCSPEACKLEAVTSHAAVSDTRYSLGVTSGDWNQDGFPDLIVSNIGANSLLINCGDGSFKEQALDDTGTFSKVATSLAMGDITLDHLPDLFVLNYVDDETIGSKPKVNFSGSVEVARTPFDYKPALDDLYTNNGLGGWIKTKVGNADRDASYGLGIVIADFTSALGNEVFVGNDGKANQLWCVEKSDDVRVDQASVLGCAFSSFGAPTASMGIATGDLDRSGTPDLYITNFYQESSCLYLNENNMFRDRNVKFKLDTDSWSVLGFGSQSIDYSNNGWLDLAVTNGHVENLESQNRPFRQRFQLFANRATRFELASIEDESHYFEQGHLGRGLAKLDFNQDGRMDLVVTDLVEPAALLINQSPTTNHWIAFRLVGSISERDAIGAKIQVQADGQTWTQWVTAGDGYLCKNDPTLIFGIGQSDAIEKVTVTWPSGTVQEFAEIRTDRRIQLTENEPLAFEYY